MFGFEAKTVDILKSEFLHDIDDLGSAESSA